MEEIRAHHNVLKRRLIQSATPLGSSVLDVGCGAGGDLQKWFHTGVKHLDMCDPESLDEAQSRASTMKIPVTFYQGCILSCPKKMYDVIAYNFSLHYIFESKKLFFDSLHAIKVRLKIGGRLIGIIPDSERIIMDTPFQDSLGNMMTRKCDTGRGNFGEKLFVCLADSPFYRDGARAEPIAYRDLLITHLESMGIMLEAWTPCTGFPVTAMYSQFVFKKHR
jgi:SAM-dependent methyltransferase